MEKPVILRRLVIQVICLRWQRLVNVATGYALRRDYMSEHNGFSNQQPEQIRKSQGRYVAKKPVKRKRRNNKPLLLAAAVVAVVLIVVIIAVSLPKNDSALLGVWQYDKYTQYEFNEDGKGCLCADDVHYEYQYKVRNSKLEIDFIEDIVRDCNYKYSIDANKLTLTGGEGTDGGTYKLTKVS